MFFRSLSLYHMREGPFTFIDANLCQSVSFVAFLSISGTVAQAIRGLHVVLSHSPETHNGGSTICGQVLVLTPQASVCSALRRRIRIRIYISFQFAAAFVRISTQPARVPHSKPPHLYPATAASPGLWPLMQFTTSARRTSTVTLRK